MYQLRSQALDIPRVDFHRAFKPLPGYHELVTIEPNYHGCRQLDQFP